MPLAMALPAVDFTSAYHFVYVQDVLAENIHYPWLRLLHPLLVCAHMNMSSAPTSKLRKAAA